MATLSVTVAWDETVAFVRREGRLLFPVAFMLIALPAALAEALSPASTPGQAPAPGLWLLIFPVALLLSAIGNLAISALALRPGASVAEALRRGAQRLLPLLGVAIMIGIAAFILFTIVVTIVVAAIPGAVEAAKAGTPNAAFGTAVLIAFVLLVPIVLYFGARLMLVTPLAAGEEGGPFRLIGRSWTLTRGQTARLVGLLLLVMIAYLVLLIAVQSIAGLAIVALLGPPAPGSLAAILVTLVGAAVTTLLSPYLNTLFCRIYLQLAA
jgi:hypothetical protein